MLRRERFSIPMEKAEALPHSSGSDLGSHAPDPAMETQEQLREPPERDVSPPEDVEKVEKPVNPWMDPSSFPDGGSQAWLTVAGAAACLFVSFGWVNCVGIFQDYYQTHQLKEYSPSNVAWIPSLQGMRLTSLDHSLIS